MIENFQNKKILVMIPARGGSKGILHKNIRLFAGKPLIFYIIQLAKSLCGADFRVVVSTDTKEIAEIAQKYGAEVPFLRPKRLARDQSLVAQAGVHLLQKLQKDEGYSPEYIMHLQPPSPLAESDDIYRCMDALSKDLKADAALTVCRTHPLLYHLDKGNYLKLVNKISDKKFVHQGKISGFQRQKFPNAYKLNGCFVYLVKKDIFLKEQTFQPKNTIAVVVDMWRSVDIDTPEDFVLAETIYRNREKIKQALTLFK